MSCQSQRDVVDADTAQAEALDGQLRGPEGPEVQSRQLGKRNPWMVADKPTQVPPIRQDQSTTSRKEDAERLGRKHVVVSPADHQVGQVEQPERKRERGEGGHVLSAREYHDGRSNQSAGRSFR